MNLKAIKINLRRIKVKKFLRRIKVKKFLKRMKVKKFLKRIKVKKFSLKLAICIFLGNINSNPAFATEKNTFSFRSAADLKFRTIPVSKKVNRAIEKVHALDLDLASLKLVYSVGQDLKSLYRNKKNFKITVAQFKVISQFERSKEIIRYIKIGASYCLVRELSILLLTETGKVYDDFHDKMRRDNIRYESGNFLQNNNNIGNNEYYLN